MTTIRKLITGMAPHGVIRHLQKRRRLQTENEQRATFYAQFVSRGDIVFDIGANRGNRIDCFRMLGASVHAFEPQPSCFEYLSHKYRGDSAVTIHGVAVGSSSGTAKMRIASNADVLSSLSDRFIERVSESSRFQKSMWDAECEVTVQPLDLLIDQCAEPDFIKIDVEGFELEVLQGLSRGVAALAFEWTPEMYDVAEACLHRCEDLGMSEFNLSIGESMRFCRPWRSLSDLLAAIWALRDDSYLFGDIYSRRPL